MDFVQVRVAVEIVHYVIVLSVVALIVLHKPSIYRVFYKSYLAFCIWLVVVYLSDGCPLTHLENRIAIMIYGKPFHPGYSFRDSDASKSLAHIYDIIIPFILVSAIYLWQRIENPRRPHRKDSSAPSTR